MYKGRGRTENEFDSERDKKKQEVKECKMCGKKYFEDYLHLKTKCYIYHKVRHIAAKYLKKSNN